MNEELKAKILNATDGSKTGAILRCALGEIAAPGENQRFVGKASITSDGFVMCDFIDSNGEFRHGAFVGAIQSFDRNILGLADHLKLDQNDRTALIALAKSWISKDWRI
jgi:hypothetical protein